MNDQKNFKINIDTGNAEKSSESLNAKLKEMQKQMAELIVAGKENSDEFNALAAQAGALKDAIGDASKHIQRMADDTKGLNDVLDVSKSAISVFGIMQSATAALGLENNNLTKSIQKLQAAQSALQGIQQLQNTLMDKSSMTYKLLNTNIITFTTSSKAANIALKALNASLKAIGIGLVLAAISEISEHMDDIKDALSTIIPSLKDETAELERQKQLAQERAEIEARRAKNARELRILQGDALQVYKEELEAAKNAEEAAKNWYDERKDAYDRAVKAQNRTQSAYNALEEKMNAALDDYNVKQADRIKKQELYNKELARQNKLLEDGNKTNKKAEKTEKEEKPKAHGAASNAYDEQYREEVDQTNRFLKEKELLLVKGEMSDENYRIAVLENYDELIRLAEEYGKETIDLEIARQKALNELYESPEAVQAEDITEERQQKIISNLQEGLAATEQLTSEIFSAISSGIDNNIKVIEKALNKIDKALDKTEKSIDDHKDNLSGLYAELAESEGANRDALLESIEIERNAMNAQFEEQKRLEAEKAAQEAQLKKEQAKKERMQLANQLVLGIANTAMSITQTAGQLGFPAAIPFIALAGATGAIQTALIASQIGKLKYEKGGLLNGKSHKDGGMRVEGTNIEVEGGEYVVNKKATRRYLPLLEAINGTTKFANGGEINLPSSDNLMNYTNFEFSPVVSVTDINKANTRLNKVRAR